MWSQRTEGLVNMGKNPHMSKNHDSLCPFKDDMVKYKNQFFAKHNAWKKLDEEHTQLKADYDNLYNQMSELQSANEQLSSEITVFSKRNKELEKQNKNLKAENKRLKPPMKCKLCGKEYKQEKRMSEHLMECAMEQ